MNRSALAPIVFFAYNRPVHTRNSLESLMANDLASKSDLFIYCDGPKKNASTPDVVKINQVRKIIREKKWCGQVTIVESEANRTLPVALPEKVSEIINRYGKIIVLEDDLILSKGFLNYMNEALVLYEQDARVMHVSGYMYPSKAVLPETFFLPLATCWGWGTWKRAWDLFDASAENLLSKIDSSEIKNFDLGFPHYEALQNCAKGPWKSWDIRWYASVFVHKGLCLHPRVSLVRNIGHDNSGVHCKDERVFSEQAIIDHVQVKREELQFDKRSVKQSFLFQKEMYGTTLIQTLKTNVRKTFPFLFKLYTAYFKRTASDKPLEDWSEHVDLLNEWGNQYVWDEIKEMLSECKGKALDIGCGTGAAIQQLVDLRNLEVHGCDVSEKLIQQCIAKGIPVNRLRQFDIRKKFDYQTEEFDYTYSIGVLHYLTQEELTSAIREIARITRKISFHFIPVSLHEKDEGWVMNWHKFQNNSQESWRAAFSGEFSSVEVKDSGWTDKTSSKGKWFICIKNPSNDVS